MEKVKKIGLLGLGGINWIGGVQYISNIVQALNTATAEDQFEVHIFKDERQQFVDLTGLKHVKVTYQNVGTAFPPWTYKNRAYWYYQRRFTGRVAPRVENFFIDNNFDFVYPVAMSNCGGKLNSAAWIADFQYHHYPEGASRDFTDAAYGEINFIAKNAHKIILSSKTCELDCNTIFPHTVGRTFSMPFAVYIDEKIFEKMHYSSIIEKYRIPKDFLIVSNSFCPTKNHTTLFKALGILKKQGITVNLLCTGNIVDQRNLHFANSILQSITENGIRDQVHLLGIIPREDQLMLYRMSKAIVQPSLNEGWSTSVEEAKALGKDLVVSDISVHQEQCSDKRYMFSAKDPENLAAKIKALWISNKDVQYPDLSSENLAFASYKNNVADFVKRFKEIMSA